MNSKPGGLSDGRGSSLTTHIIHPDQNISWEGTHKRREAVTTILGRKEGRRRRTMLSDTSPRFWPQELDILRRSSFQSFD
ncbi:hypothetical protein Pcinc_027372 [Petrolisthes cinctipes]|uniref:Uncharacterized protein n=1 Tax=Petrolisthes cinctipes TaxID=88211 RepID=A0AAE1F550_PETCI|nr:hypothetical protein Pcinc_027372 [Petrolisthes cinctipes]